MMDGVRCYPSRLAFAILIVHQEDAMRTTITIPDSLFNELMSFTEADSRTEAVQVAVETYVRRAKLERLRALRGKLDITGTEAMDQADLQAQHEQFDC